MNQKEIGKYNQKITLEDLRARKREVLSEIRTKQEKMSQHSQHIFAPFFSSIGSEHSIFKKFNTGLAIFDGVVIGMKMIKSLRKIFRRK